jgi:5-bromo-4-chloroindolyl phosphate hydrolysis protein
MRKIEKYLNYIFKSTVTLVVLGIFELIELAKGFPIFIAIGIAGFIIKLFTDWLFGSLKEWESW